MAIRIENTNGVQFGTLAAAATITHVRGKVGRHVLFTEELSPQLVVAQNSLAELVAGALDVIINKNEGEDAGLQALVEPGLANPGITVELLTDATTEVAVTGYTAQTVTQWSIRTEADG